MSEQFDFSKKEEQKQFQELPKAAQEILIEQSQDEANKLSKKKTEYAEFRKKTGYDMEAFDLVIEQGGVKSTEEIKPTIGESKEDVESIMTEETFTEVGKVEEGPLPDLPPTEQAAEESKKGETDERDEKAPEEIALDGEVIGVEKIPREAREINPELLLAATDKQGEKIDSEVKEKKNWVREKVEKTADWYKKQALWKKVLFSTGCIGVASASAAIGGTVGMSIAGAAFAGKFGQRMLGGMATFVTAEGFLKQQAEKGGKERTEAEAKRHTIEAAALGVLVGGGAASQAAKELFGLVGDSYNHWFPKIEELKLNPEYSKVFESHPKSIEEIVAEQKGIATASIDESHEINEPAIIKKGEGIWHAVRRQLEEKIHGNPNVYGLNPEDLADEEKIKAVANKETGKLLAEQGYIKPDGTETWVSHEGTKVLLGADNKISISGEGDNLTYEVAPEAQHNEVKIPEVNGVEVPEIKPAYMVNEPEAIISKPKVIPLEVGEITPQDNVIINEFSSIDSAHEVTQPEAAHAQPVSGVENVVETKIALINNEIIQQHLEGENKISEFVLNDENLRDVKFKILTDINGNSEAYILGGKFLNSAESVNGHLTENWDGEILKKSPEDIRAQVGRTAVLAEARNLEIYERALKYLENNSQGNSTESGILKNQIKRIIEGTEKTYGHVFVDKVDDFK